MKRRPRRIHLRRMAPSLVTIFAICAGLTAVRMTLEGRLETGLYFILLAMFLDAVDGKLARFLDSTSLFGAELDSLADFFNFGIAPGIILFHTIYLGTGASSIGWLATLVLAACCALRLARFNLASKDPEEPATKSAFFVGVPAPALACLALMPIFVQLNGLPLQDFAFICALYTMGVGLLAVSTIPTFSVKHASIRRSQIPMVIILSIVLVTCLMVYPWPTLIAANLLYLASMPFSYLSERKQAKAADI